jgi:hypothetical protein
VAGKGFKVEFEGLDAIRVTYGKAPDLTLSETRALVNLITRQVASESQKLVPVYVYLPGKPKRRGGALKDSMNVQISQIGRKVEGTITYGGAASKYAFIVHERIDPNIRYSTPGTGPKYLERPTMKMAEVLPTKMNFFMRRILQARPSG